MNVEDTEVRLDDAEMESLQNGWRVEKNGVDIVHLKDSEKFKRLFDEKNPCGWDAEHAFESVELVTYDTSPNKKWLRVELAECTGEQHYSITQPVIEKMRGMGWTIENVKSGGCVTFQKVEE